jgi:cyclopropane fatty-acyl-phospholipid synthase-like methyltransferase
MQSVNKDKIYENYVDNHTMNLYGDVRNINSNRTHSLWDKYYLSELKSIRKDAKILEIGCGNGTFLNYLKIKGFVNLRGIDMSAQYLEQGKQMGHDNIHLGDLFEELSRNNKYDLIIAIDVLEHFQRDDIMKIFDLVIKSLNFGGLFLFQVPNGHGVFSKIIFYSDFTHETLFSKDSILQTSGVLGFTEAKFSESSPRVIGFKDMLRFVFWKGFSYIYKFIYFVETGRRGLLISQNIIVFLKK